MRSQSRLLGLLAAAQFLSVAAFAANYNDVNADLSNDHTAPTAWGTLDEGANTLTGKFTATNDYDYIKFTVPTNHQLTSITLTAYTNGVAGTSFMAIQGGDSITPAPPNPGNANGLLGYVLLSGGAGGKVGTDVLDDMGASANGASGFTPPLPAGNYSVWLQDFDDANTTYTITFNVAKLTDTAVPVFTPTGGSSFDEIEVAMTCATAGATIYYTTDGSTPTTASTVYTTPLILTSTTTVKAYAVKAGNVDSAVRTEIYTVTPTPKPKPTLKISGSKSLKVTKPTVKIKGTAKNATSVKYKVGNGPLKPATGSSNWVINAKLKPGKNVITIEATGAGGKASTKVTVTFKKKK